MKKISFKALCVGAFCMAGLAGCMSHSPSNYRPSTKASHFDLAQDDVDTEAKNILGEHVTQTLQAGHYVAVFEDNDYVFYECADKCVLWGLMPAPTKGGICLPKPGSKANPYLWVYVRRSTQNLGIVGNMMDKAEAGNIRVLHYASGPSADFMKKILVEAG